MVACDALIRRSAQLTPCCSIMRIGLRLSCTLLLAVAVPAPLAQEAYDLVIAGGFVVDGTGTPGYRADVAVAGERIVAVGLVDRSRARRVIDAGGLWVTPGFIDPHSHAAGGLASAELNHARPLLAQGITTVFVNPDGGGPVDLVAQRGQLLEHGLGVNVAQLVGHGSIRSTVIGRDDRAPTADELDRMRALAREAMEQGAFGLSSGLFYAPGSYAEIGEVVELGKVVARYGGVYTSHIRDESDYTIGLPAAIDEVIRVAREAGMRGSVTHIKALGPRVWGTAADVIAQIEQARAAGVEVFACQYPYTASATGLSAALLDRWIQEGGREQMLARLRDPEVRRRVRREMVENLDRRGGAERIQFRRHQADPSIEGRTLAAVAAERGQDPVETALALIEEGGPGIVSFNMTDADVELFMRQPWVMTCTDGGLVQMGSGVPHPRNYGTYPRKLRQYVIDDDVIGLSDAVRSMTYTPATLYRVADRGIIRVGAIADLAVIDPVTVRDTATFTDPHQLSEGMVHVLVNGQLVIDDARFTGVLPGQVLSQR